MGIQIFRLICGVIGLLFSVLLTIWGFQGNLGAFPAGMGWLTVGLLNIGIIISVITDLLKQKKSA